MAVSRLHISVPEFYAMTPREFHAAITDHADVQRIGVELVVKAQWESTRMLMYEMRIGNPHLKKHPKKPEEVLRFTWDKLTEPKQDVNAMREALIAIHVDAYKRNKNKPTTDKPGGRK